MFMMDPHKDCITKNVCSVCLCVCLHRSKYGSGNLEGNRFKIHGNGTLEIKRTGLDDQGTYSCVISNIAGRDEDQVRLEVKGEGPPFL